MQAYMIEDILHLKVSLSSVLTVSNGWGWGLRGMIHVQANQIGGVWRVCDYEEKKGVR
jgi:hypothetical protein